MIEACEFDAAKLLGRMLMAMMENERPSKTSHSLQCMAIWGGCSAADQQVSTPGLDLWIYSLPHEQAVGGGDVHYVSVCGGGIITRFILADVSGHGASVAQSARALREVMRRNINRKSQVKLIRELNRQFLAHSNFRRFATAIVATYLTAGAKLTVCNAGHPRPLIFRAATGFWSSLADQSNGISGRPADLPLGIDDSTEYTQVELPLDQNDLVLFYTDALTEAASPDGRMLGEEGLLDLVRSIDPNEPALIGQVLLDRLDSFREGQPADDDLTFLLLRHNASGRRHLGLVEKLDVYAKVFGLKSV